MAQLPRTAHTGGVRTSAQLPLPLSTTHTAAVPGETVAEGDELQIEFRTDSYWTARGTRAQLEAAGLVPEGVTWPEGTDCIEWTSGRLLFNLWRDRFKASRKPKKAQLQRDSWVLRCWRNDRRLHHVEIEIRAHIRAIEELRHSDTKAGRERFDRYLTAECDDAFMAFMKTVLPRQGKSGCKARVQEGGAQ
jgi:hypothetical protein